MLRSAVKRLTTWGFRVALRSVHLEWRIMRSHWRGVRRARDYRGSKGLQLHLGCGANLKPGWVNIDPMYDGADLTLDLREQIPLDDASCSAIYSEHFLEHLEYPGEVTRLLGECLRVLEPGGLFSVSVPDTESTLVAYVNRDEKWLESLKPIHPPTCRTPMDHVNHHFRQGNEHKMAYDEETLLLLLRNVGFEASRRTFDPELDSERRRHSLFVEAVKPNASSATQ